MERRREKENESWFFFFLIFLSRYFAIRSQSLSLSLSQELMGGFIFFSLSFLILLEGESDGGEDEEDVKP